MWTPKSAAILISLKPEGEKVSLYAAVLREGKSVIDVKEVDIGAVNLKILATGARLLKIPGEASSEKIDKLAQRLLEVLLEDIVQIFRPCKTELKV